MRRGEPSRTAFGAALHRAVHQDLEGGRVFRDPLAWRILGPDVDREQAVAEARGRRATLRLFIAVRHRFAEDSLASAAASGVRQAVVLGAGLDTFGYRNPHAGLHVFEVDHPDTGGWKQERLAESGIVPAAPGVSYVGVDFERDALLERLAGHGFDPARPACFVWLGVVPYLSVEAVEATLREVARVPGAEVVLDYPTRSVPDDPDARGLRESLARRTAAMGEPLRTSFEPAEMERLLREAGYDEIEDLGRREMLPRFFGVEADPASGAGGAHVVRAGISRPRPRSRD